ncbi:NAD(P)/FAD-dependent oxidoreductase [Halomarina litorea]|uniref:NAD(P)/FAD-dependent oxidoreductase n=1 Tax=Halomarina litorea TaxID=2961595 RepID=UPI0020C3C20F|nr:FAD-dependent oxidoreductase [Halomarina sp. BCD28]
MHVVVVGGGIVGLASAHALATRDVEVTVCEQGSLGNGSTERSVGGIRSQFSTPVNVALSRASVEVWERFENEFGVDIAYRRPGYLFLAREESTAAGFEEQVAMQRGQGVESELLTPEEARERCPELHAGRYRAATYCPTDGFADPHLALQGYADACREAGVEVRTKTAVTDVRLADGAAVGVETDGGRVDADFVVNAAGPWAARVGAMAGLDLPVSPRRRQVLVTDPDPPVPESVPLTVDLDSGVYFRPEREGSALVGGHLEDSDDEQDPGAYTKSMDLDWATTAVERAAETAGYFGPDTELKRGWAGLYAVTPDHHPVVEESLPGFVNAVGFSGHGFQHAPATGRLVAELVCDGAISLVDPVPLSSDRFDRGEGVVERNVA